MTEPLIVALWTRDGGPTPVVIQAPRHTQITADLWDAVEQIGDCDYTTDGDLISVGTPGRELGRVTYRRTGSVTDGLGGRWYQLERVDDAAAPPDDPGQLAVLAGA